MKNLIQALRRAGIEAQEGYYGVLGNTPSGSKFYMTMARSMKSRLYTLEIDGMNRISRCRIDTAIQRINEN